MADSSWIGPAIQWTVWGVLMSLVMVGLARSRTRNGGAAHEQLRLPKGVLALSVVGIAFFLGLAILAYPAKTGGLGVASVFMVFAALSGYLALEYFRVWHTVTSEGLDYGTMFRGRKFVRWEEVSSVNFSPAGWFVLKAPDKPQARISAMLRGLPEFASAVLQKVPLDRLDSKTLQLLQQTAYGNLPRIW